MSFGVLHASESAIIRDSVNSLCAFITALVPRVSTRYLAKMHKYRDLPVPIAFRTVMHCF